MTFLWGTHKETDFVNWIHQLIKYDMFMVLLLFFILFYLEFNNPSLYLLSHYIENSHQDIPAFTFCVPQKKGRF